MDSHRLKGGSNILKALEEKGRMSKDEALEHMVGGMRCQDGSKGCRAERMYRAEWSLNELIRRGAVLSEGDDIVYGVANDYKEVMDRLSEVPVPASAISDDLGWDDRYVSMILRDLRSRGIACRGSLGRKRMGWMLGDGRAQGPKSYNNKISIYGDRIVALLSAKSMLSVDLARAIGQDYRDTTGMLRVLKARGVVDCRYTLKGGAYWFASDEARLDAESRVTKKRDTEARHKAMEAKPFSRSEPIRSRNPDFVSMPDLENLILKILAEEAPMSEEEMRIRLGRTRTVKKAMLRLWNEDRLERTFCDGEWKWTVPVPEKV